MKKLNYRRRIIYAAVALGILVGFSHPLYRSAAMHHALTQGFDRFVAAYELKVDEGQKQALYQARWLDRQLSLALWPEEAP